MRMIAALLVLGACGGTSPTSPPHDAPRDGRSPSDAPGGDAGGTGLAPGTFPAAWIHGSQNCGANADPELQVHAYNATTIIFRQNKCRTFEAPFIYLLVGQTSALLIDSGATGSTKLRETVRGMIGTLPLVVAHTHAHGDHTAGDGTFANQPNTTVIGTSAGAVQAAFGAGTKDLGGRVVDVFPIPGHQAQHFAFYDRATGLLFTGDTLYPGLLFISDWTAYRASVGMLAAFVAAHPISYVLGAHVEMTATPKQVYPYGTTYQPAEHLLQLGVADVTALQTAVTALGASPPNNDVAYDNFVISPQ